MTVAGWNLLVNLLLLILGGCYGIWLTRIVGQQLRSKDATIEALRSGMEAQKAEIERLKAMSAPRIAEEWRKMKDFAEDMTHQKKLAEETARKLEAALKAPPTATEVFAAGLGLMEAVTGIDTVLTEHSSAEKILSRTVNVTAALGALISVRNKLAEEARAAHDGKLPEWYYIKGVG